MTATEELKHNLTEQLAQAKEALRQGDQAIAVMKAAGASTLREEADIARLRAQITAIEVAVNAMR